MKLLPNKCAPLTPQMWFRTGGELGVATGTLLYLETLGYMILWGILIKFPNDYAYLLLK